MLGMADEIIAAGGLARRFDSQGDNGVESMRELKEARGLPRLELELHFTGWRLFAFGSDDAAIDRTFDLASSKLQKPSFACDICHKNSSEIIISSASFNQAADIRVCDLCQIRSIAADRHLRLH